VSVEFAPLLLEPAYRKVAAAIGERILTRTLHEGERLPSETELARQFGVNRSTVREALRELESRGLVQRRPGSKLMSVSRPRHEAVAAGVSHALLLHDATVRDVWEALTILEPPIARAAARERNARDLAALAAAIEAFSVGQADTEQAVHGSAEVFRRLGEATHNPVLGLAQEPLLQLLEPSLRVMIDKVPQARARIGTAHRRLLEALEARDQEGAHTWMTRHIRDFRRGYEIAGIDLELHLTPG
jgi:GntR family transcriptional repressor for pyruvate dehydrogenase complex